MENTSTIFIKTKDKVTLDKILFYLDGDSRPAFEREVPKKEKPLFATFEHAIEPIQIDRFEDNLLTAYLEPDSFEDVQELAHALALLQPLQLFVYFANDEDARLYFEYKDKRLQLLLSEVPVSEQEEAINQKLDQEIINKIVGLDDKAEALRMLSRQ